MPYRVFKVKAWWPQSIVLVYSEFPPCQRVDTNSPHEINKYNSESLDYRVDSIQVFRFVNVLGTPQAGEGDPIGWRAFHLSSIVLQRIICRRISLMFDPGIRMRLNDSHQDCCPRTPLGGFGEATVAVPSVFLSVGYRFRNRVLLDVSRSIGTCRG